MNNATHPTGRVASHVAGPVDGPVAGPVASPVAGPENADDGRARQPSIAGGRQRRDAALATLTALVALASALCACGGGADEMAGLPLQAAEARTQAAPDRVTLEGCVVDPYFVPRTGTSVRVVAADGRLLGDASSDKDGRFTLQVPGQQVLSLNVDNDGGETQAVTIGQSNLSVSRCLIDPQA